MTDAIDTYFSSVHWDGNYCQLNGKYGKNVS